MSSVWVDLLGAQVRFYDAGGIRTRCIEAGDGPPVIFLHGVGGHCEAFARNVIPLSDDFRVIALDYLGFGLTDIPEKPADVAAYVDHLLAFMDAAGIEKAHLAGESLGGWVATWAALLHPDRVDKLVSICGARLEVETDAASEAHVEAGRNELQRLTKQFIENPSRENVRKRLEWLFYNPERDISEELVDIRWALYQRADLQRSIRSTAPGSHGTTDPAPLGTEELAKISQKTLVLWTSHNPSTTAATAERAAEYIPDAQFKLMQDCGHWPQWENPEEFNRIIRDFLKA